MHRFNAICEVLHLVREVLELFSLKKYLLWTYYYFFINKSYRNGRLKQVNTER